MPDEKTKPTVTITVSGPVGRGKSLVLSQIENTLRGLGAHIVSSDLDIERRGRSFEQPSAWELELIAQTDWRLEERTTNKATTVNDDG